jgi:CRISPR-associated protein Csm4
MIYYRITLTPLGPISGAISEPWASGTIWGHIAWAIRYTEGEKSLQKWIQQQESEPWLFSSQMPEGMLPKPFLKPMYRKAEKYDIETLKLFKDAKKSVYIREETFLCMRDVMSELALMKSHKSESFEKDINFKSEHLFHNQINRRTGRTPETGGLFVENFKFPQEKTRFQLFMFANESCQDRLEILFKFIGTSGFGANASTGKGAFQFEISEETRLFKASGSRAMSLSHGIITTNMENPRYKQHTHYGKLGGHYAAGMYSPFKYPILMAKPGATFTPTGKPLYGELLGDIHHDKSLNFIKHHAFHLPVFFTEAA